MRSIFFIGECMVELQREGDSMRTRFGGDTLNSAVYLSRLIDHTQFDVAYVSAIGTDSLSDDMHTMWQQEHLNTQWVQRLSDKLPGIYLIETDQRGERSFHFWRNDSAARYWMQSSRSDEVCAALAQASAIYLSGISLAILSESDRTRLYRVLAKCRVGGGQVIFDNNYRPRLWPDRDSAVTAYRAVLQCTDIALLTQEDEDLLYGPTSPQATLVRTQSLGVREIVIKRGAMSCIVTTPETQCEVASTNVTSVVDTTAAGDSFGAAYIAARLNGGSAEQAAQAGHRLAATVIQHRGAIIPRHAMPER
jgi:2-dehydro-3-deoxygluconokinase